MRIIVPIGLSVIVAACSQAVISSPGKSDDAIRADMNSCNAGSLSLHDRSVINCLNNHGDTITYGDGTIPPYTDGNSNDVAMTAAEVQRRQAAATAVLNRWQTAQNSSQSVGVAQTPPSPSPSSAEATTFITDSMYADLKEMVNPSGNQIYPNGISDNPKLVGIRAETVGDYFFWRNHDNGNNQEIHWSSNKDMQDFVKARRWYQFSLSKQTGSTLNYNLANKIKSCDFALGNESGSARSEVAEEKRQEQAEAEERQRNLAVRKKVGDCVVIPGGTGFLGLGSTTATVTGVSGSTISWVAHLHRNGYWYQGIGVKIWNSPQDFDREGSSKYNEVTLCNQP
jgi:hypothetical protein